MPYTEKLSAISHIRITIVTLVMDWCGRTFGSSPCTGTGSPCYNTFPTCKSPSAFDRKEKAYDFSSAKSPTSEIQTVFRDGSYGASPYGKARYGVDSWEDVARIDLSTRPYVTSVEYLPIEIKTNFTIRGRVKVAFFDEPDTDVGIDPYLSTRFTVEGTFWKKWLARNQNYKGRKIIVSEGFLGLPQNEFRQVWQGTIDAITISGGQVKLEAADFLDALADVKVPKDINCKLTAELAIYADPVKKTDATALFVDDAAALTEPTGYIRVGDEIMSYAIEDAQWGKLAVGRGQFESVRAEHKMGDSISLVRYFAPANPFDILQEMLSKDGGLPASAIDSTAFAYWKGWPGGELPFRAVVSEQLPLSDLYFELVDLLNCKSWITEGQQITIRRNVPNEPGRAYVTLTDAVNLVIRTPSIDLNPGSRVSRVLLYWDKDARLDLSIDKDAESKQGYGEPAEKVFYCRWLAPECGTESQLREFIDAFSFRQIWYFRNPLPLFTFRVELKDRDIAVGDYARFATDEIPTPSGAIVLGYIGQVVKKQDKDSQLELTCLMLPVQRAAFYAPDTCADYATATDAEKEYAFFSDDLNMVADGVAGYFFW
ncbi:MAG: hypothetical protein QME66_04725 [Candidatus Eisenbacteria bacterium]|nr:hypothetical protein [Candidatus Eisenbacteria bacterium]